MTPSRLALTLLALGAAWLPAVAQTTPTSATSQPQTSASQTAAPQPATAAPSAPPDKPMTPAERRRAELDADIKRLDQLAKELKAEVDKTDKNTLSVKVIKKAQEIEALARSIKERSKQM